MHAVLRPYVRPALGAVAPAHQNLFKVGGLIAIESLDIDESYLDAAFLGQFDNDSRWDYYVLLRKKKSRGIFYLEVHRALPEHVSRLIRKAVWLRRRIEEDRALPAEDVDRPLFWIPAGPVHIVASSIENRVLSLHGIVILRRDESLEDNW